MKPRQGKSAQPGDHLIERRTRILSQWDWSNKVVLDYGVGNGAQTKAYAHLCKLVYAYDPNLDSKDWGRSSKNKVVPASTFIKETFDAVFSFCVLEHVENEDIALQEIVSVLKPGGELIITVPNKWWIFEMHGAYLPKILPWNRVPFLSWLPGFIHSRIARARIYTKKSITKLLRQHDFKIEEISYITAPMDRVKNKILKKFLQTCIFDLDQSTSPFISTEILVYARKT